MSTMAGRRHVDFSGFLRGLAQLSGGVALGQLLVLAASPLLSRLYTPEDFGIFGIVASVAAIVSVIVCLRYELVIPLVSRDEDAAILVVACRLLGLVSVVLLAAALAAWHVLGRVEDRVPDFLPYLWWLVPGMIFWSEALPLHYETLRRRAYLTTGLNRLFQSASQVGAQIGLGLLMGGAGGLVAGHAAGFFARWLHYRQTTPIRFRQILARHGFGAFRRTLLEHRRHGLLLAPAALMQAFSQASPVLLMAFFHPMTSVGAFTLAYKILDFPSRLLASTASAVFLREAGRAGVEQRDVFFVGVVARFFLLGAPTFGAVALLAPELFVFAFGSAWREAGEMARYLALLQIAKISVVPVSQAVTLVGRQDIYLFGSILQIVGVGGAFLSATWLGLDAVTTTAVYAAFGVASWVAFLVMSWRAVRQSAGERPSALGLAE